MAAGATQGRAIFEAGHAASLTRAPRWCGRWWGSPRVGCRPMEQLWAQLPGRTTPSGEVDYRISRQSTLRSLAAGEVERSEVPYRQPGPLGWITATNHNASVIAMLRRVRRALPGDPEFGDPLSAAGEGGPRAAARAADRLLEREHGVRGGHHRLTGNRHRRKSPLRRAASTSAGTGAASPAITTRGASGDSPDDCHGAI